MSNRDGLRSGGGLSPSPNPCMGKSENVGSRRRVGSKYARTPADDRSALSLEQTAKETSIRYPQNELG